MITMHQIAVNNYNFFYSHILNDIFYSIHGTLHSVDQVCVYHDVIQQFVYEFTLFVSNCSILI